MDPPSYTIKFGDSEEERHIELSCLRHPHTEALFEPADPSPPPFMSQSTASNESSGNAHCDTSIGMAEESPTTLSITHKGVVWSIGKETLKTHLLAVRGRLYPGSDQQPGYAAVLASCDRSWVASFRDLPELRANNTAAIEQIRNRLHTIFRRGYTGMAPDLQTPPLGEETMSMLFANILQLVHAHTAAAAADARAQMVRLSSRWL